MNLCARLAQRARSARTLGALILSPRHLQGRWDSWYQRLLSLEDRQVVAYMRLHVSAAASAIGFTEGALLRWESVGLDGVCASEVLQENILLFFAGMGERFHFGPFYSIRL